MSTFDQSEVEFSHFKAAFQIFWQQVLDSVILFAFERCTTRHCFRVMVLFRFGDQLTYLACVGKGWHLINMSNPRSLV